MSSIFGALSVPVAVNKNPEHKLAEKYNNYINQQFKKIIPGK